MKDLYRHNSFGKQLPRSLSSYGGGGGLSRHQSRTGGATSEHIVSSAPRTLKPPRQNSGGDGDWLLIDRVTYMYMAQDFTHVKTMLHKLRRILHTDSSPIPFDSSVHSPCRMGSVSSESPLSSLEFRPTDLAADNCQLRHQVAQLQHELDEKNRTIHLLQQQLAKYATAVDHVAPPSGVL